MNFSASFSAQPLTSELLDAISSNTASASTKKRVKTDCLVVAVFTKGKLGRGAQALQNSGQVDFSALFRAEEITGKLGEVTTLHLNNKAIAKVIIISCGPASSLTPTQFRQITTTAAQAIGQRPSKKPALLFDDVVVEDWDSADKARCCAEKITYQQYQFTTCKSDKKATAKKIAVSYYAENNKGVKASLQLGTAVAQGMNVARELGNLPGNICTPSYLANQARQLARTNKTISSKILSEKQMRDLGMGSLLSVSAGSKEPAQLIVMEYKGTNKSQKPHVLVGKGITFDTGGISLKPGASMDEMKFDMCGAASVFGTMHTIAALQPTLNVVAIVAAAENMPSDKATKPGDIVTSMAGKTIEVLNTDAEGRLVLCDALTYAERYQPKTVVDIATLTGACVVALGSHASGLFSNNDNLTQQLLAAGDNTGERAWHMPLWDDYKKQLKSNFADLANIGGREAGSITAACFLSHFTEKYPWAHIDIAGTAWLSGAKKGATGRPVPLLTDYLLAQQ